MNAYCSFRLAGAKVSWPAADQASGLSSLCSALCLSARSHHIPVGGCWARGVALDCKAGGTQVQVQVFVA